MSLVPVAGKQLHGPAFERGREIDQGKKDQPPVRTDG
jgi:hypothetical protein